MNMLHTAGRRQGATSGTTKSARTRLVASIAAAATLFAAFGAGTAAFAGNSTEVSLQSQAPVAAAQNSNEITPPPANLAH